MIKEERAAELNSILDSLSFEELSNIRFMAGIKIEDVQHENSRRNTQNVTRGEFEDLAARLTLIEHAPVAQQATSACESK